MNINRLNRRIFKYVDKERLRKVVEKGSELMGMSKEEFRKFIIADFINAYSSGYFGDVSMEQAGKVYFEKLEKDLLGKQ